MVGWLVLPVNTSTFDALKLQFGIHAEIKQNQTFCFRLVRKQQVVVLQVIQSERCAIN